MSFPDNEIPKNGGGIQRYKNNGDIQSCNNYRCIKLLNHTMKIWEREVELSVSISVSFSKHKFKFMSERSTTEGIHLVWRIVDHYRERRGTYIWCSSI